MLVLGVETSCDETSVAIVRDGREVLANIVYSQIGIHKKLAGLFLKLQVEHVAKITLV